VPLLSAYHGVAAYDAVIELPAVAAASGDSMQIEGASRADAIATVAKTLRSIDFLMAVVFEGFGRWSLQWTKICPITE
jgi:hypothetical protein